MSLDECHSLLASVPVGRVGLSIDALPLVLAVNFAPLDRDIVFHGADVTKFDAPAAGAVVAFEADTYQSDGASGWSALVHGVCKVINEPAEVLRAHQITVEPQAVDGSAYRFARITASVIAGCRSQPIP